MPCNRRRRRRQPGRRVEAAQRALGDAMAVDRLLVLRTTRGDVTVVELPPGGIALREAAAAVVQRRGQCPHAMAQLLSDPAHRVSPQYPVVYVSRSVPVDVGFLSFRCTNPHRCW
jgi:hypothetical protein